MTIALSVNLNKIALLRNSRDGDYPNLTHYAKQCLDLGAAGLTVHPRPDQRHIRPADVHTLSELRKAYSGTEFNIEGNPFAGAVNDYPGLLKLVEQAQPEQCTLVPDSDAQKTSDHGFDLIKDAQRLQPIISALHDMGVRVSLFMDPDVNQIRLAKEVGADRIELYTGPFAWAYKKSTALGEEEFQKHVSAANTATELGMGINAGHDLNLENLTLYKKLPHLKEVSIGHALTVDALNMGYTQAVTAYINICK